MKNLIIKLGAAGDVVRTTSLLNFLPGTTDWITSDLNEQLLKGLPGIERIIPYSKINSFLSDNYDLVINLEDNIECGSLLQNIQYDDLFGAYINDQGTLEYTDNSHEWFDMSLISRFGKEKADQLKYRNRKTFQEMIFKGLGRDFNAEKYLLPASPETDLQGDIAISLKAGDVWPMKNWAYYDELACRLKDEGLTVNFLPERPTMLNHLSDVRNHKLLISGDSLPMHFALGSGIHCLTLFICTSPYEIYDYGIMKKIVSPDLGRYFYRRDFDIEATRSISFDEVLNTVQQTLKSV